MSSSAASAPTPGAPAEPATYSERLLPAFWVWVVAAGISGASIVTFAPINLGVGFIAAAVVAIIITTLLLLSTPQIIVTPTLLTVGRATIERQFVGAVCGFDGAEATQERGPRLNATAYLCIRGWIPSVVRIEITDPQDPTPYWLVSTRRPAELSAALAA